MFTIIYLLISFNIVFIYLCFVLDFVYYLNLTTSCFQKDFVQNHNFEFSFD